MPVARPGARRPSPPASKAFRLLVTLLGATTRAGARAAFRAWVADGGVARWPLVGTRPHVSAVAGRLGSGRGRRPAPAGPVAPVSEAVWHVLARIAVDPWWRWLAAPRPGACPTWETVHLRARSAMALLEWLLEPDAVVPASILPMLLGLDRLREATLRVRQLDPNILLRVLPLYARAENGPVVRDDERWVQTVVAHPSFPADVAEAYAAQLLAQPEFAAPAAYDSSALARWQWRVPDTRPGRRRRRSRPRSLSGTSLERLAAGLLGRAGLSDASWQQLLARSSWYARWHALEQGMHLPVPRLVAVIQAMLDDPVVRNDLFANTVVSLVLEPATFGFPFGRRWPAGAPREAVEPVRQALLANSWFHSALTGHPSQGWAARLWHSLLSGSELLEWSDVRLAELLRAVPRAARLQLLQRLGALRRVEAAVEATAP